MDRIEIVKRHIRDILELLDDVDSDLVSARNWGIYDILGGKTLVGLIKHNKISNAEDRLDSVVRELQILQGELREVNLPTNSNINAGNFNKFMDIFVDNTIANWYTQAKISDGRRKVKDIRLMLEDIYRDLDGI